MRRFLFFSVFTVSMFTNVGCEESASSKETKSSPQKEAVTWIPYWEQDQAFQSFRQYHNRFTYLDLFWYRVDPDGSLATYEHTREDETILQFAREHHIKVFALVANMTDDAVEETSGWDAERVRKAMMMPASRSKHVQELLALVDRHQFDGITIDYEELQPNQKESFTKFIKLLGTQLHTKKKKLAVAVYPKRSAQSPEDAEWYQSQDIPAIAPHTDRLYIMAFGEHWEGGPPGPKASEKWLHQVLNYMVKNAGVSVDKICVELEADGIDTNTKTKEATGLRHADVEKLRKQYGAKVKRYLGGSSPFFTYRDQDGHLHEVWYEDATSVRKKMEIAYSYGIRSIGYWNIGKETPELMQAFPVVRK